LSSGSTAGAGACEEQTSSRLFSSLLLQTPKCDVNALAKSEQVKTFCVKEYYLDSKNSLYATLTQIGFNEFHYACTLADNGFPHDSDQNKYGAW